MTSRIKGSAAKSGRQNSPHADRSRIDGQSITDPMPQIIARISQKTPVKGTGIDILHSTLFVFGSRGCLWLTAKSRWPEVLGG